ncbi:RidA family protein [Nesterenkonia sp. MY13]|uniref:RidA family protein n=1 Tax=Nesterenkonia sedimenti TaxID=1463632 RepID=A0A7X8TLF1_9MICC|nr:RidA family protein [Nesterenkonia sedimenti]NLS10941.1 RidA family protein [Nesterenkonia sedimenti]
MERIGVKNVAGARASEAVATDDLIFFSGIHAEDRSGDIGEQTAWCLNRLSELLGQFGQDESSILMIHIWLKDMRYFSAMNKAWNTWIDPENPPARTCVSGELFRPDALIEVVAIAERTQGAS